MRYLASFYALFLILLNTYSQESQLFSVEQQRLGESLQLPNDSTERVDFSMNVGMSAFSDFEGMYGFNTYVAPQWSIIPLKNVQVDISPYMGRTSYYNVPLIGQSDATKLSFDENMMNFGVYAQGLYMVNESWYVGASVFLDTHIPETDYTNISSYSNYGASTIVGYKFSEGFSMQASFGVSKQPSFYSPTPGIAPYSPRNPYNRFK